MFCFLPKDREFSSRLQLQDCRKRYKEIAINFKSITTNTKILTVLELIEKTPEKSIQHISTKPEFKSIFGNIKEL